MEPHDRYSGSIFLLLVVFLFFSPPSVLASLSAPYLSLSRAPTVHDQAKAMSSNFGKDVENICSRYKVQSNRLYFQSI